MSYQHHHHTRVLFFKSLLRNIFQQKTQKLLFTTVAVQVDLIGDNLPENPQEEDEEIEQGYDDFSNIGLEKNDNDTAQIIVR